VVLYMLHSLLLPLYLTPSSHSSIVLIRRNGTLQPTVMKYTQAQMNRMKEANKARQAAQPLKLIKLVKELQQESGRVAEDSRTLNAAHQNAAAAELASRLKAKLYNPNNQQGLDKWRRQRLKLIKKREEAALATAQESGQEKEDVPSAEELAIVEASSLLVEEEGTGLLPSGAEIGNHDTALQ
jgi:hypothetical protein